MFGRELATATFARLVVRRGIMIGLDFFCLSEGKLAFANLVEWCKTILDNLPDNGRRYPFIFMPQHVSDTGDIGPWNIRVTRLYVIAQMAACF